MGATRCVAIPTGPERVHTLKPIARAFAATAAVALALQAEPAKQTVLYAGLAYLANCNEIARTLRYIHEAIGHGTCDLQPSADAAFSHAVDSVTNDRFDIVKHLGQSDSGDGLSIVLALERENVWSTSMRDGFAIAYDVSAQLLIFNFTEKKIVGVFPIHIRYFDFVDQIRSHEEHVSIMRSLVLDQDFTVNLLQEFVSLASDLAPKTGYGGYLRVRDVDLADRARAYLDEQRVDHDAYRTWIAQVLSQALSRELEMPILPYTTGHAIGGKIAGRFANGRAFMFTLPAADYVVDLHIRGMARKKLDETRSRAAWSFVFGVGVTALEPLSGATYLNANFQKGRVKIVSNREGGVDEWGAFSEAAILLAEDLASQVVKRDAAWIREHSPRGTDVKSVRSGLDTFMRKVVERVR